MPRKLTSRKFWVSVITAGGILVSAVFGLDLNTDQVVAVLLPVVAYVLGESYVDSRK